MRRHHPQRILIRAAVLLLLFAVVGLSTLAKDANYLPKSNPLHHFSKSTKMELLHHPLNFDPSAAPMVCRVGPSEPGLFTRLLVPSEGPTPYQIALAIFFQRRAPPSLPT